MAMLFSHKWTNSMVGRRHEDLRLRRAPSPTPFSILSPTSHTEFSQHKMWGGKMEQTKAYEEVLIERSSWSSHKTTPMALTPPSSASSVTPATITHEPLSQLCNGRWQRPKMWNNRWIMEQGKAHEIFFETTWNKQTGPFLASLPPPITPGREVQYPSKAIISTPTTETSEETDSPIIKRSLSPSASPSLDATFSCNDDDDDDAACPEEKSPRCVIYTVDVNDVAGMKRSIKEILHHQAEEDDRFFVTYEPTYAFALPVEGACHMVVRSPEMWRHARGPASCSLTSLDLRPLRMDDYRALELSMDLDKGKFKDLEELAITSKTFTTPLSSYDPKSSAMSRVGVIDLMEALESGACPSLTSLEIASSLHKDDYKWYTEEDQYEDCFGKALAKAVRSGHLKSLTSLNMGYNWLGHGGGQVLADALRTEQCSPNLKHLDMSSVLKGLDKSEALRLLNTFIWCLPQLESLVLNGNELSDGSCLLVPLTKIVNTGGLVCLQQLYLDQTDMTPQGARLLAKALPTGMPLLRVIDLHNTATQPQTLTAFLTMLHGPPGCPNLESLNVSNNDMDDEQGRMLASTITIKALSNLKVLDLSYNTHVDMVPIFKALQTGACADLRSLRLTGARMSHSDARALASLLLSRACPQLEELDLQHHGLAGTGTTTTSSDDDNGLMSILGAISKGSCGHLKALKLEGNCLSPDHAWLIGEALDGGKWKELEELTLDTNAPQSDFGLVAIMHAMKKKGSCPNLHSLTCHIGKGSTAAHLLSSAMATGSLPCLRHIKLSIEGSRARMVECNLTSIFRALACGMCPDFKTMETVGRVKTTTTTPTTGGLWSLFKTMYRL